MAIVYNATSETQHIIAMGNHFTLKPKQIKQFQDHIAHFIALDKPHHGVVVLPEAFEEPEFAKSDEGKKILAEKTAEGVQKRVSYLKSIVYNNQVSLKQDLEKANIKVDPRIYASDGEIAAMEALAKYQDEAMDEAQKKVDKIKELEKKIGKAAG